MYTQCPRCRTVFTLTSDQLAARGGLVRCGRCSAIFRADRYLREHLTSQPTTPADVAPETLDRLDPNGSAGPAADTPIPTIMTLSDTASPKRASVWVWWLGVTILFFLLVSQYIYAYRPEWLQHSQIQPWVHRLCGLVSCPTGSIQAPDKIELVEAEVLPHPKYEQALRVSALLVNRANFIQAFPWLEITLTDNRGQVVARRVFQPRQYLEQPAAAGEGMQPGRSTKILLDLTSPGGHAVGYEIRLVVSPS